MRIYEFANLTELRKDSEAIKSLHDLKMDVFAPLDHEENRNRKIYDLMKTRGWQVVGAGTNASVFINPSYPFALKIFRDKDICYTNFVEASKQTDNPHLPKFKGKVVSIGGGFKAVRLEKLKPLSFEEYEKQIGLLSYIEYKLGRESSHSGIENTLFDMNPELSNDSDVIALIQKLAYEFEKENPNFTKAFAIVSNVVEKTGCSYDFGNENFMKRGQTIVIADPLYPFFT